MFKIKCFFNVDIVLSEDYLAFLYKTKARFIKRAFE